MAIATVIYGMLGIGGIAGIAYFFTSMSGGKGNILKAVHDLVQNINKKKIEDTEKKQKEVKSKIVELEAASEESKKKIKQIKAESAKKIVAILAEDEIAILDDELDNLWKG